MRSYSRVIARLKALSQLGLAPELVVPEMAIQLSRALRGGTFPAVFVLPSRELAVAEPAAFTVWLGADQTVRELRQLLKMGIWPGPRDTPSLQTILAGRVEGQVFAATLWGEGCSDEGPWGDLWRSRGIQQGLQAVYFPKSGSVAAILISRATGQPPFSAADLAFGEAVAPFFENAIAAPTHAADTYDEPVPTVQLVLDAGGKPDKMSFGTSEMLSDVGGGGPDAVEITTALIEKLAASRDLGKDYAAAADPFIHLRRKAGRRGGSGSLAPIEIARNAFGRFSIRLSPLAGGTGEAGQIATISRHVPRALVAIRGALRAGASARELELIVALVRGETLEGASAHLGIGLSSTRTMLERIMLRARADSRAAALSNLIERGRAASW
jgi:hypothetical protein